MFKENTLIKKVTWLAALYAVWSPPLLATPASTATSTPIDAPPTKPAPIAADVPGLAALLAPIAQSNLQVQLAALDQRERSATIEEARAARLPAINLRARYSLSWGLPNLGDLVNPAYQALNQIIGTPLYPTDIVAQLPPALDVTLSVTQPLYAPMASRAIALAAVGRQGAEYAQRITQREVIANVRKLFYAAVAAQAVLDVLRANLPVLEEAVRVTQTLVNVDKATADALLLATASLEELQLQIRKQADAVEKSKRALQALVGIDADVAFDDAAKLQEVLTRRYHPPDLRACLRDAQARRSEIGALSITKEVSHAAQALARAQRLPTLALAVDLGVQEESLALDRDSTCAMVSLVGSWNVFDGGKRAAQTHKAALGGAVAEVRLAQQQRDIAVEVRDAHAAVETAALAIASSLRRKQSEDAAYQVVATRFAAGSATTLELNQSQTRMLAAGIEHALSLVALQLARAELARTVEEPLQD